MLIRVYNHGGKVKVTKVSGVAEQVMFSDLADGEMAEVEIGTSLWTKSNKAKTMAPYNKTSPTLDVEFH